VAANRGHFARLMRLIGLVEETLAVLLLIGISAVVLLQVFGRYIFVNPFIWPEELTRLMLVWLTFVGAAAVTRRGAHIAVDMLIRRLPPVTALVLATLVEAVTAGTFIWVTLLAARLAQQVMPLPLAATQWSMGVMVWPAVVGCALIAAHALIRTLAQLRALVTDDEAARQEILEREVVRS